MKIQAYQFAPGKYEGRYWNSNGFGCAVIASVSDWGNGEGDWAAYIGGAAGESEEADLDFIAAYGAKLSEEDAQHFFPGIGLPYRH